MKSYLQIYFYYNAFGRCNVIFIFYLVGCIHIKENIILNAIGMYAITASKYLISHFLSDV